HSYTHTHTHTHTGVDGRESGLEGKEVHGPETCVNNQQTSLCHSDFTHTHTHTHRYCLEKGNRSYCILQDHIMESTVWATLTLLCNLINFPPHFHQGPEPQPNNAHWSTLTGAGGSSQQSTHPPPPPHTPNTHRKH